MEDAVGQIKQGTRNYAKRQLTWFKRENRIQWLDIGAFSGFDALAETAAGYIRETLHIPV
jgi:tRNA dimethylallyltransferase